MYAEESSWMFEMFSLSWNKNFNLLQLAQTLKLPRFLKSVCIVCDIKFFYISVFDRAWLVRKKTKVFLLLLLLNTLILLVFWFRSVFWKSRKKISSKDKHCKIEKLSFCCRRQRVAVFVKEVEGVRCRTSYFLQKLFIKITTRLWLKINKKRLCFNYWRKKKWDWDNEREKTRVLITEAILDRKKKTACLLLWISFSS
jgi:hypothetical protein